MFNKPMAQNYIDQGAAALREANDRGEKANTQTQALNIMDQQAKSLPSGGLASLSANAPEKMHTANLVNNLLTGLGLPAAVDPNKLAALEDIHKNAVSVATASGGHSGAEVLNLALARTPDIQNTPEGFKRLSAGLRQSMNYERDRAAFMTNYVTRYGHSQGAEQLFQKLNPPEKYAREAVISSIEPVHLSNFLKYVAEDPNDKAGIAKARAMIDKKYGVGASDLVLQGR